MNDIVGHMAIKQRLNPSAGQAAVMLEHAQMARFVYNLALEQRSMWTKDKRHFAAKITTATQMRELAELRGDLDWVGAGSSVVQQGALRDLDRAFDNFFAGRAEYPQFKRRTRDAGSFVVRDVLVKRQGRRTAVVHIPKVGYVRFVLSRPWADIATATSARVTLRNGRWHVSFTTKTLPAKIVAGTGAAVGIDRGVANSIATSDHQFAHAPGLSDGEQARFLALQRRKARQVKGSNRQARTKASIGRIHARLSDRRTDWVEQSTTRIARTHDLVALEALNTTGMTRKPKPKPDPDTPGVFLPNGARAKAALNKAILASCWGAFARRLTDKMPEGSVILVDPKNTSRACNECGHTSKGNRQSQAVFTCEQCGHAAHADTNAARNILDRAINPNPRTAGARTHQPATSGSRVNHPKAA